MRLERVESVDDPRVAVFRELKDRDVAGRHGRFIAEGEFVVRRLLASGYQTECVLMAERCLEGMRASIPEGTRVYAAPQAVVNRVVGFRFHSGVVAAGVRRALPAPDAVIAPDGPVLVVVCPEISNAENLGGLIRVSAGFGATALVLGERSCDPFFRQAIRVSMGTVFSLPIAQSLDLATDLDRWGEQGIVRVATVLDADATPLSRARRAARMAVLFGNEAQGLSLCHVARCDEKVTIPMKLGTDSLNVAVSAGIILHHYMHGG